jgi:hypothetical protein
MTFKLKPNPTFWAKVEIYRPGEGPSILEVEFAHRGFREALELASEIGAGMPRERQLEVLCGLVRSWRGADADFSEAALRDAAEDFPGFAASVLTAYLEELRGARRKN